MDHMERRQNEELMEARRLRRQEQKRKLLMRQRVLAAVLLVIFVLSLILILRGCRNRREHPELYAKKDTTLQLETEHRDHLRRRRYHDHGRAARRREAAGRQL